MPGKPKNQEEESVIRIHSVYLLRSEHPKYKGANYIGYTTNPRKRIRQHNGEISAGAYKTKHRRPWKMICFVYGFPNEVAGLQFEWAFQHPRKSRRVREATQGRRFRSRTWGQVQILHEMLSIEPWTRYPLKLNWTHDEFKDLYKKQVKPIPSHMSEFVRPLDMLSFFSVAKKHDGISSQKIEAGDLLTQPLSQVLHRKNTFKCSICTKETNRKLTKCPHCQDVVHILCIGRAALGNKDDVDKIRLLPRSATCPNCDLESHWSKFVEGVHRTEQRNKNVLLVENLDSKMYENSSDESQSDGNLTDELEKIFSPGSQISNSLSQLNIKSPIKKNISLSSDSESDSILSQKRNLEVEDPPRKKKKVSHEVRARWNFMQDSDSSSDGT